MRAVWEEIFQGINKKKFAITVFLLLILLIICVIWISQIHKNNTKIPTKDFVFTLFPLLNKNKTNFTT